MHEIYSSFQIANGRLPRQKIILQRLLFQRNHSIFRPNQRFYSFNSAVKLGSTALFTKYISENKEYYIKDRTTPIVMRLHHNVIQAALVKLSLSYSSIYLDDVAKKIQLEGPDIEFVVAKVDIFLYRQ